MEVKEAVRAAKEYAAELFEGETIRLEEVWFDYADGLWCVTIGLQRPEAPLHDLMRRRTHYKTVRIDDKTGTIKSVRNHDKMPVSP